MNKKYIFPIFVLALASLVSVGIVAHAQDTASANTESGAAVQGITFPIPELGNCADKDSCRTYCNAPANMQACVAFAQAHGLMNKDDASRADSFRKALQSGGGPGGCKTPDDCKAFCGDNANLEVCTQFAKDHGVKDANVEQSDKILAYLKAGGKMPGDCTSAATCKAYCSDFSHAQECFDFAKAAHIGQGQLGKNAGPGGANGSSTEATQQKFLSLVQGGQTPGGCASKDACEAYCKDQTHRDECTTFAVHAGFITQEQADHRKQDQGKGPGGCDSQESCQAYCNDQTHRDECLKFAEDHGVLNHDQVTLTTQQLTSLRAGLEQAPAAVTDCLKSALGANVVDDIQSGAFVPNPDAAATIKDCFQKFGAQNDPSKIFKNAPPQVTACLKDKLGDDFVKITSGQESTTPEMADNFRVCFQSTQLQNRFGHSQGSVGGEGKTGAPTPQMFQNFLRTAPPELQSCLKEKLGDNFAALQSGSGTMPVDTAKLKSCFEQFRPTIMQGKPFGQEGSSTMPGVRAGQGKLPAEMFECLKQQGLSEDALKQMQGGTKPSDPATMAAMQACAQKFQSMNGGTGAFGNSTMPKPPEFEPNQPGMQQGMPGAYNDCINSVLGADGMKQIQAGQITADQKMKIAACVQSKQGTNMPTQGQLPMQATPPTAVLACANSVLGDGGMTKLQSGQITADQKQQIYACVTAKMGTLPTGTMPPPSGTMSPPPTETIQPPPPPPPQPPTGDLEPPPGTPPPPPDNTPQTNLDTHSFLGDMAASFRDFFKSLFQ